MSKKVSITLKAVAAFKVDYLTAESVELDIQDGVVVGIRNLTRAPDQHATAIANCIPNLWSNLSTNKAAEPTIEEQPKAKPKSSTKEG